MEEKKWKLQIEEILKDTFFKYLVLKNSYFFIFFSDLYLSPFILNTNKNIFYACIVKHINYSCLKLQEEYVTGKQSFENLYFVGYYGWRSKYHTKPFVQSVAWECSIISRKFKESVHWNNETLKHCNTETLKHWNSKPWNREKSKS